MVKNLLILRNLGMDGTLIDFIVNNFTENEYELLFSGDILVLQFKYGVFNEKEIDVFLNDKMINKGVKVAEEIMSTNEELGIQMLTYYDDNYPESLKKIKKKPLILYVKGNLELLNYPSSIACVGTRNPSNETVGIINKFVKELVDKEVVIVSGLAKGVDTYCHKSCLLNNGKTIGVLAHGLDNIYPKENQKLADDILANSGLLLSEYPVGSPIKKQHFVARNKIVSGLSQGVIIFEADESSGTMHTARFAYSQSKKIFCPATSLNKKSLSSGVKKLLDSGYATAVGNSGELLTLFKSQSNKKNKVIVNKETVNEGIHKLTINLEIDATKYEELKKLTQVKSLTIEEIVLASVMKYIEHNKGRDLI